MGPWSNFGVGLQSEAIDRCDRSLGYNSPMQYGPWDTDVEARIEAGGAIHITSFTWQGRRLPVIGHGRTWRDEAGRHFLVMAPGEAVFELCLGEAGQWRVLRAPDTLYLA